MKKFFKILYKKSNSFLFILFIFISSFLYLNIYAKELVEYFISDRFSKEEVETLGYYENFSFPEKMMNKNQNILKISAQNVLYRFVTKKSSLSQYPGKAIKAMAYFELLFNELLKDPTFETTLLMDIVVGRNTFRDAFGFPSNLSTENAIFRYWTLGELLDQGKVKNINVPDDILDRKILLRDLKNRIGQMRSQIDFDTSIKKTLPNIDENIDSLEIINPSAINDDLNNVNNLEDDFENRLQKIKNYYEKGLINKQEYDDKKQAILDEL